ncbi:hypothetical protein J437_LFUL002164 [Ladona fulva]|uniref:Uncharacterized protein n=1 Tax=Ladona fulva TaxID=123851 RepID=A0A8K0JXL2_LADFU|nr:hypothetical protein J437_LFUL002164 [Ladona fulva]
MSGAAESICNDENINSSDSVSHCSIGHSSCNMKAKEVLEEFKKLYESRIKRIDQEGPNSLELKVKVLEEWVQELYKQNAMLVDAAEELEREACERVALLESRLKCSARAARESTLRLQQFESQALEASAKRVKAETSSLISGDLSSSISLDHSRKTSLLEQDVNKDSIIARLETEVTRLSQELALCESAQEINRLGISINERNEDAREARDVLTNEVAQKHDQVLLLRSENEKLEEDLHKASMQTRFKDDIIKEMRQEIRAARAKVAALEYHIECHNMECHNVKSCRYHNEKSTYPSAEKHDLQSSPQKISSSQETTTHRHANH